MRILVTGGSGLVGTSLLARAPARGADVVALSRAECDVTAPDARSDALRRFRPDAVLFCAAATAVDAAGAHSRAVNALAPAEWAREVETWFLSSNFVFSTAGPHPPEEAPSPVGAYAEQKVEAEQSVLAAGGHVVRVGWVWGPGGRTFASSLPASLASGNPVRAIADVLVQPTLADDLADALLDLPRGVTHLIGRDAVSWYGFALAARAELGGSVIPVTLAEFGLRRPRDARLAPATLPGWRDQLDRVLRQRSWAEAAASRT